MSVELYSDELIAYGTDNQMQDFYIKPGNDYYEIYFRKGPFYFNREKISLDQGKQLISRFKYIGEMDVSEHRKTQFGATTYPLLKGPQRLRLSSVGDYRQRESLVIRFLHTFGVSQENYCVPEQLTIIQQQIAGRGLFLFSGPVGSGKTTLMYKLAQEMEGQVITIEDPVEIEVDHFLQLQINDKINQDYDELIKLSLRHHPDILIIGEIRDTKTIQAAVRAALTGHCVFATIHAKDLAGATARAYELGGETDLLKEVLKGVVYQELLPIATNEVGLMLAYEFLNTGVATSWGEGLKAFETKND